MQIEQLLESFNLDPISGYESFGYDDGNEINEYIREASTDVTKQNIFQKLFNLAIKIIKFIVKKIKALGRFIKNLFTGNRVPVDDIVEESLTDLTSVSSDSSISEESFKSGSIPKKPVKIVSVDDNGNKKELNFELLVKPLEIKIKEGTNLGIKFHGGIFGARANENKKADRKFVNKQPFPPSVAIVYGIIFIKFIGENTKQFANKFNKICNLFGEDTISPEHIEELYNLVNAVDYDLAKEVGSYDTEFTLDDFEKAAEIMEAGLNALDKRQQTDSTDEKLVKAMNMFNEMLVRIQFGINFVSGVISGAYMIDAKYHKVVKSTADLDKFVMAMIKHNIPSKFIAYNAYLISDESLVEFSDINNPKFGQGRVAFYPSNQGEVIKVALNRIGLNDNKKDSKTYDLVDKAGFGKYLAKVIKMEPNSCVEIMERLQTPKNPTSPAFQNEVNTLGNILYNDLRKKTGFVIEDIHAGNCGYRGNQLACFDYGWVSKSTSI